MNDDRYYSSGSMGKSVVLVRLPSMQLASGEVLTDVYKVVETSNPHERVQPDQNLQRWLELADSDELRDAVAQGRAEVERHVVRLDAATALLRRLPGLLSDEGCGQFATREEWNEALLALVADTAAFLGDDGGKDHVQLTNRAGDD